MDTGRSILSAIGFALMALLVAVVLVGGAALGAAYFSKPAKAAEFVAPTPKVGDPIVEQLKEQADPALAVDALSGVLITQCNQVVAAYVTLNDGRLVRFDVRDQQALSATALEALVYSSRVSERVEFSCDGSTIEGFERHAQPI